MNLFLQNPYFSTTWRHYYLGICLNDPLKWKWPVFIHNYLLNHTCNLQVQFAAFFMHSKIASIPFPT